MKEKLKEYKNKLEKGLCEYMALPGNERSATAIRGMLECWTALEEFEKCLCTKDGFSREDAKVWNAKMVNDDGTVGGHWTMEQTNTVARNRGIDLSYISDYCWNTAMNMMYSDYCTVAKKHNVSTPEFYADMAKAFLFDKDAKSPNAKMAAYFYEIVERGKDEND